MTWLEDLPTQCPPDDTRTPNDEYCFRIIQTEEPCISDFYSHEKLGKRHHSPNECVAHSVSIFINERDIIHVQKQYPPFRNKKIIKIKLNSTCGVIRRTANTNSHHDWWVSSEFNINNVDWEYLDTE